ncbi:MAG: 7TM-DISM domain-containing protein, partial [Leptospirales bacterium]
MSRQIQHFSRSCALRLTPILAVGVFGLAVFAPLFSAPPPPVPDSRPAILLETKMAGVSLGGLLYLLRDRTRKLDLSGVRSRDAEFQAATRSSPGFGFSKDAHWGRLRFRGGVQDRQHLMLEFAMPSLDTIDVYLVSPSGAIRHIPGGDVPDFRHRAVRHRNEVVDLRFPEDGEYSVYIRLTSTGAVTYKLKGWDLASLTLYLERERLAFGVYFGIMVAMLVYNMFVFLSIRDLAYLYYVIFIVTFVLMQAAIDGNAYQYLWPAGGMYSRIGVPVLLYATVITAGQFARRFVLLPHFAPVINKLLMTTMSVAAAGIAATVGMELMEMRTLVLPANLVALVGIGLAIAGAATALY